MSKILYLTTSNTEKLDSGITNRLSQLDNPGDIDIQRITHLDDIKKINIKDYSLIIFDAAIEIHPWKIIDDCKKQIGKEAGPVFWIEGELNAITQNYMQSEGITGSVLVIKDSKELIASCNGKVDGSLDSTANNIGIDTQHNICSIGKMLTGLVILKLVQAEKLSLDDMIYKYLPDNFPEKEKFKWTTVRQLITHTSGMGNYTGKYDEVLNDTLQADPDLKKLEDFCKFIEHPDKWKTGDYCYSNVGFVVLGEIIEQVINKDIQPSEKKKSYWDAIEEYILKPAESRITRDIPISDKPFATNSTDIKFIKTVEIASSPAGANMWATPEELGKFSNWFIQQIKNDPTGYKRVLMSNEEPKIENMQRSDLVALKEDGQLTVYWIEKGKIVNHSFSQMAVQSIVNQLPAMGRESTNLELIQNITSQYGCSNLNLKQQLMNTRAQMFRGEEMYYSFGVMTSKNIHGQDYYHHNGGAPGISSYLQICPAAETTEIIFINNDSNNARLAERVASKVETNVISATNIYYADKKFSENSNELFKLVAKDAGVELASRSDYKL